MPAGADLAKYQACVAAILDYCDRPGTNRNTATLLRAIISSTLA